MGHPRRGFSVSNRQPVHEHSRTGTSRPSRRLKATQHTTIDNFKETMTDSFTIFTLKVEGQQSGSTPAHAQCVNRCADSRSLVQRLMRKTSRQNRQVQSGSGAGQFGSCLILAIAELSWTSRSCPWIETPSSPVRLNPVNATAKIPRTIAFFMRVSFRKDVPAPPSNSLVWCIHHPAAKHHAHSTNDVVPRLPARASTACLTCRTCCMFLTSRPENERKINQSPVRRALIGKPRRSCYIDRQ